MTTLSLPARSRSWPLLTALLVVAFALRLVAIAKVTGLHAPPVAGSDESEYDTYAWNVAQGNGYRGPSPNVADQNHLTAYRPPAPSLFLAALYVVFGHSYVIAYVADVMLAVLTVWLIHQIALRCFDSRAAWVSAVFYALYPISIYFGLTLNSEVFSTFLLCLFVWCCLGITQKRGMRWATGAGIALGLILLSKPAFVFLLPLLPVWAWSVCRGQRHLWRRAAMIPALAAILMTPWIVRNLRVMHAFIPFSTSGGSLLLQSNNRQVVEDPAYYGYSVFDYCLPEYAGPIRTANDEIKRDAIAKRFAIQWLRANPDKWFYLLRSKFLRLWSVEYAGSRFHAAGWIMSLAWGTALAGFVLTVIPFTRRMVRERHPGSIMVCLILAIIACTLVFFGQHRYRFPIDGFCIIIAAGGAFWLWDMLRRRSLGGCLHSVGAFVERNRLYLLIGCIAVVAMAFWCRADTRHIERWREAECQDRLRAIAAAATEYRVVHGELPPRLSILVPQFLPNVEALHCPKHSISYHDHGLLPATDAELLSRLISYSLLPAGGPGGEPYIIEDVPEHGPDRDAITLTGKLFRSSRASPAALAGADHSSPN